jgi:general stress protein 26
MLDWNTVRTACTSIADGAYLATTRHDGHPHVAWVGIGFDANAETMWTATYRSSQKAKNLRHDHRVALHWPERPDQLIFMRAVARLVDDADERRSLWDRTVLPYDQEQFYGSADNPELLFVELTPVVVSIHDGDPTQPPRRFPPST